MNRPPLYGAIDLGGTSVRAIVADLDGRVYGEEIRPSETERGPDAVFQRLAETLEAAASAAGGRPADLRGVGICSPGTIDVERGVVSGAPQLPGWEDVPLVRIMSERLGVSVWLDNDASAAALGEHTFGAGRGSRHMLYITVSTGIGGGIIIHRKLYRGAAGSAGELGHIVVDINGPRCGCGSSGCLEALASGTAIARQGEELLAKGESPRLAALRGRQGRVTAEMVAQAATAGDEACRRLFAEAGRYIGAALASYVNIFNPEVIIVGGGVARSAELFLPQAERTMRERAMAEPLKHVRLALSALGERVGPLGMIARLSEAAREKPA
ncbi:MAG: ROK family protein [Dehalococcoidia bacterium]|nr:ROK family protein [Dehalococcoidia bacterium]